MLFTHRPSTDPTDQPSAREICALAPDERHLLVNISLICCYAKLGLNWRHRFHLSIWHLTYSGGLLFLV